MNHPIIPVILILLLAGCGSKHQSNSSSQVMAKVNGEEITVHQFNLLLSHSGKNPEKVDDSVKKQIINDLIEETLLTQQAITAKLDRDPQAMIEIEEAKRRILAQVWLEKSVRAVSKPSQQEIDQYYEQNPELFSKHNVYNLKEIIINNSKEIEHRVEKQLEGNKQLDEFLTKLDADKIVYQASLETAGTEALPIALLPAINDLKDGQFTSYISGENIILLSVLSKSIVPIEKKIAEPVIVNFLMNERRKQMITNTLQRLKEQADIQWVGEYAKLNAEQQGRPAQENKAPEVVDDKSKEADINKGIKGL